MGGEGGVSMEGKEGMEGFQWRGGTLRFFV
jgi:hypothetical protein